MKTTSWYKTTVGHVSVLWINGDEGTGKRVCSVYDPKSTLPARRVLADGRVEALQAEPTGLTVYGLFKWDRPTFKEFSKNSEYGYLVTHIKSDD